MLDKYAAAFFAVGHKLASCERILFEWQLMNPDRKDAHIDKDHLMWGYAIEALSAAKSGCGYLPLGTLDLEIERALGSLKQGVLLDRMQTEIHRLSDRFRDELESRWFYGVAPDRQKYYGQKALFGPEVSAKFSKCLEDIESAGNCYALGQPTACVLHLMRAMGRLSA
jgi:hypothetical protein